MAILQFTMLVSLAHLGFQKWEAHHLKWRIQDIMCEIKTYTWAQCRCADCEVSIKCQNDIDDSYHCHQVQWVEGTLKSGHCDYLAQTPSSSSASDDWVGYIWTVMYGLWMDATWSAWLFLIDSKQAQNSQICCECNDRRVSTLQNDIIVRAMHFKSHLFMTQHWWSCCCSEFVLWMSKIIEDVSAQVSHHIECHLSEIASSGILCFFWTSVWLEKLMLCLKFIALYHFIVSFTFGSICGLKSCLIVKVRPSALTLNAITRGQHLFIDMS